MVDLYKDPRGEGIFGKTTDNAHSTVGPNHSAGTENTNLEVSNRHNNLNVRTHDEINTTL